MDFRVSIWLGTPWHTRRISAMKTINECRRMWCAVFSYRRTLLTNGNRTLVRAQVSVLSHQHKNGFHEQTIVTVCPLMVTALQGSRGSWLWLFARDDLLSHLHPPLMATTLFALPRTAPTASMHPETFLPVWQMY